MTKIICIEIEKPRNCPYRVQDMRYNDWMCTRSNKLCSDDDTFPCWCMLIDGRRE